MSDTIETKHLSREEKLRVMEALWDDLSKDPEQVESPDWHRDVLEERKKKIENGQAEFISLDKLRASRRS
jgi:putative addiction module component (TIGR02574 family)